MLDELKDSELGPGIFNQNGNLEAMEGSMTDVTDLKKAEEKLSVSETRNKELLKAFPDSVFLLNKQGVCVDLHAQDPSILAMPKDEIIGKNVYDVLPKELCEKIITAFENSQETKATQIIEFSLSTKEELRHFETRIIAKENDDFLTIIRDVSKQKNADFLKGQVRKILELIAQNRPLQQIGRAIVETMEGHIAQCMASILLFDQEELALYKLAAPNLPQEYSKGIEGIAIGPKVGSSGTAAYLKKEVIVKDIASDPLWEEHKELALEHGIKACWSFPIISSKQQVLGVLAIYCDRCRSPDEHERDIEANMTHLASVAIEQHNTSIALQKNNEQLEGKVKERTAELKDMIQKLVESNLSLEDQVQTTKAAENRAVDSQEMFSAISKNFPHGAIAVIDTQSHITHLDGEELTNFRLKGSDFKGASIDEIDLLSEGQKLQIKKVIAKTLDGNHMTFETRFRKRDYAVNTMPMYGSDKQIKYALFVYNNISKQKEIELENLNALTKEKELGELKSRFVDMASHEFRTPLSAILSAATLIGKQNGPGKEGKREGYVGRIKANVKNMVVILNDFLSISKLEEGKISVHPETFDLVGFSKSVIEEVNPNKKKGQRIQQVNENSTVFVHLDSKMTHHILVNLLTNAIKYSPENKKVILTIGHSDRQIYLMVKDRGIGIPKAEQKYLFQRFYRAKNAMNIQGTGLGLHIVKQYTQLMGGTVSFISDPSKGTIFTVQLPLNLNDK